jgi:hypothetical protein
LLAAGLDHCEHLDPRVQTQALYGRPIGLAFWQFPVSVHGRLGRRMNMGGHACPPMKEAYLRPAPSFVNRKPALWRL